MFYVDMAMETDKSVQKVNKMVMQKVRETRCLTCMPLKGLNQASTALFATAVILMSAGCTPTVKVAPPDKPITINMNINIKHEIKVKVDKALDDLFSDEEGLF